MNLPHPIKYKYGEYVAHMIWVSYSVTISTPSKHQNPHKANTSVIPYTRKPESQKR